MLVSESTKPVSPLVCIYCHSRIIMMAPGWGYFDDDRLFHTECIQLFEGIEL